MKTANEILQERREEKLDEVRVRDVAQHVDHLSSEVVNSLASFAQKFKALADMVHPSDSRYAEFQGAAKDVSKALGKASDTVRSETQSLKRHMS